MKRRRNPPAEFRPYAEITRAMGKGLPFGAYVDAVRRGRPRRRNPGLPNLTHVAIIGVAAFVGWKVFHPATTTGS